MSLSDVIDDCVEKWKLRNIVREVLIAHSKTRENHLTVNSSIHRYRVFFYSPVINIDD